jgi:hypothetical protein
LLFESHILQLDFRKRDTPESLWWCFPSKFIISDHADTVSRPTEDEAIVNIVEAARRIFRYRSDVFTTQMRHTEVIKLADYANRLAINPTAFSAGVLKYDRSWVRKVLVESGWFDKKATENTEKFASVIEGQHHKRRQPENRIQKIKASGTKPCPAHGENRFCKGYAYGCDDLCEECFKVYGYVREDYPSWLLFLVKDDAREARRKAQESVLHLELSDDIAA